METAKKVNDKFPDAKTVTASRDITVSVKAYRVNAYRFLLLPFCENDIFEILDDYFCHIGTEYPVWIKSGGDVFCLNSGDIYYIEADNKHSFVHLANEALHCNKTMASVAAVLPDARFLKINRAYIVNISHIYKYNKDGVVLDNGETVHISRNYYKSFKYEYMNRFSPKLP